ncbi:MAG: LamG domain-containing protein [Candidatus Moraniibacteriota bacterium]|nr:MAG: LamG domain-containing protein [Candidatus Moranbacteria bacterium]
MSTASATPGRIGQALNFDGVNDYIALGSPAVLDDIVNLTTCAWVNPDGTADGSIVTKDDSTTGWNVYYTEADGRARFVRGWSGGDAFWQTGSGVIPDSTWTHICLSYNDSSTTNDPAFYINGALVSSTETVAPSGTPNSDATFVGAIGSYGNGLNDFFDGKIDEVRVYNRVITSAEVTQLYNLGR